MRKKVAITGTAGFIGYHLALSLAKDGCEVSGWDNFNSYYSPALKEARAAQLKALNVNVHRGDLCDADGLRAWVEGFEPTHIVHLAAQAGVRYSLDNPQAYIASNIEGFVNVLEIGRSMPTIPIIYASSSSVYGLNTKTPFSVEDRCDQQASLYGVSKKTNELLAHAYHHLYQLPLTGLRFFTVYGPWGRPDMAYYKFTKAILEGQPIPVFNHGQLERDFTYIDDIVAGIRGAMESGKRDAAVYNLGNEQPVTLEAFISAIENALGRKAIKNYLPMQAGDVYRTYADVASSFRDFGYAPRISIQEGLGRFVEWYLQCHSTPVG